MFDFFCAEGVCTIGEILTILIFFITWFLLHILFVRLQEETAIGNQIVAFTAGFFVAIGFIGLAWTFGTYPISAFIVTQFVMGWIVSTLIVRKDNEPR